MVLRNVILSLVVAMSLTSCAEASKKGSIVFSSWYDCREKGECSKKKITASGVKFNENAMTAAHKTFRFGTVLKVTNIQNGKSVVVTINDRGPYVKGRSLDLSRGAAKKIGLDGVEKVRIEVLKGG